MDSHGELKNVHYKRRYKELVIHVYTTYTLKY